MLNSALKVIVFLAFAISFSSHATYREYIPAGGWSATGSLSYKNGGTNFNKSIRNNNLRNITSKVRSLYGYERELTQKVRAKLQESINGKASIRSFSFDVNGDIKITLTGLSDGTIRAKVGGMSFSSLARLRKSWYAKANVTISSNTLELTGHYNPYTGKLTNLRPNDNFKVNVHVDADSKLKFISPSLGFTFIYFLKKIITEEVQDTIVNTMNTKVNGYEDVLFGLDAYLPANQYMYRGVDYGQKVADAFKDLVSGESISVHAYMSRKQLRNNGSVQIGNLKVNISNHLYIHVYDSPTTEVRWDSGCQYSEVCSPEP